MSIDPHLSSIQTATELSAEIVSCDGNGSDNFANIMNPVTVTSTTTNNSKIQNLLSSNSQYYPQTNPINNKIGDFNNHRPIIQGNTNSASSTAFKITQVGPVIGSNVVVSRMDSNNVQRPTTASPIPISGPLAGQNGSGTNFYFNSVANNKPRPSNPSNPPNNFYQNTANNVTKFTNMTVANAGAKNPLKPNHYTVPISSTNPTISSNYTGSTNVNNNSIVNLATHPNSNLSAPNTSGIAPKTTLKAADLIHILPNLFNTLKRRNSNSSASGTTGNRNGNASGSSGYFSNSSTNALAAAVVAAASNSGKPISTSTAAAIVAEQLLNVAASGPFSDDSSSSPPPQQQQHHHHQNYPQYTKKIKLTGSDLQCEICGKVYKHRNCLSKHMWEHHESWEHTKKSCQTKHQQVQLLEAAQVLSEIISGVRGNSVNSNGNVNDSYSRNSGSEEEDDDDDEDDGEIVTEEMNGMEIIETAVGDDEENVSIGGVEF